MAHRTVDVLIGTDGDYFKVWSDLEDPAAIQELEGVNRAFFVGKTLIAVAVDKRYDRASVLQDIVDLFEIKGATVEVQTDRHDFSGTTPFPEQIEA